MQELYALKKHEKMVHCVAGSPDGSAYVTGSEDSTGACVCVRVCACVLDWCVCVCVCALFLVLGAYMDKYIHTAYTCLF